MNEKFLGHRSQVTHCYGLAFVACRSLTSSSQELQGQSNFVCRICRVRRQDIVNFRTPTPRKGNLG